MKESLEDTKKRLAKEQADESAEEEDEFTVSKAREYFKEEEEGQDDEQNLEVLYNDMRNDNDNDDMVATDM